MNAHAAAILLGDAAGGTAGVAVIVAGDAPCDMGSPPHRAEEAVAADAADAVIAGAAAAASAAGVAGAADAAKAASKKSADAAKAASKKSAYIVAM